MYHLLFYSICNVYVILRYISIKRNKVYVYSDAILSHGNLVREFLPYSCSECDFEINLYRSLSKCASMISMLLLFLAKIPCQPFSKNIEYESLYIEFLPYRCSECDFQPKKEKNKIFVLNRPKTTHISPASG